MKTLTKIAALTIIALASVSAQGNCDIWQQNDIIDDTREERCSSLTTCIDVRGHYSDTLCPAKERCAEWSWNNGYDVIKYYEGCILDKYCDM